MTAFTPEQQRAVNAATRLAPDPAWADGITNSVVARLGGDGPWTDAAVNQAIVAVLSDLAIDLPMVGAVST
jgi:hypothetical protein